MKKKRFKVALIFGTRPEIIKLSSLIRLFEKNRVPYFMIHTGQHYSQDMDRIFFKELELPAPDYSLHVRSKAAYLQGDHTGRMLMGIERILLKQNPSHVLVQGDTNSVLAGSLASSKISTTRSYTGLHYTLGHVESGLRSFDREMPEEINRFISDHLSDLCFAPTETARNNLIREGVSEQKIFVTGNTVVDAVMQNLRIAEERVRLEDILKGTSEGYLLVTLHRQENVDEPHRLRGILKGIADVSRALKREVVFPMHPRTRIKIKKYRVRIPAHIKVINPVGYLEFLKLESKASCILTDSGGLQEEACVLRIPCVTLRTTTERPETIEVGANVLAGIDPDHIVDHTRRMMDRGRQWENPYGKGDAAEKIWKVLKRSKG